MGAKIVFHQKLDYVEPARNFAISKVVNEWVLVLDPDEEINQNLKTRLIQIAQHLKQINYVRIPRKNIIFGKWMKAAMWWPDFNIRFFKKGAVKWSDKIHKPPQVKGEGLDLEAKEEWAITHHNYQTISQFAERLNRYTTIEAKELKEDGPYTKWFAKKLLDMGEMATKKELEEKEKIAKEKADKDKSEKEKQEKLKKEQELQAKLEKEKLAKELAEKEKLKKEQEELARIKQEQDEKEKQDNGKEVTTNNNNQSLENDQIKLKEEKEKQEQKKKNNQKVKSEYESEMLKIVAENEKKEKEKQFLQQKDDAESNSMSARMKKEQELKDKLNKLKIEIATLENSQNINFYSGQKQQQMKALIETTAMIEKQLNVVQTSNTSSNPNEFKVKPPPKIQVTTTEYTFYIETITIIIDGTTKDEYKKDEYWWGTYYYKNGTEIDESTYVEEITKYKTGK